MTSHIQTLRALLRDDVNRLGVPAPIGTISC
jgi:hypothetical protein